MMIDLDLISEVVRSQPTPNSYTYRSMVRDVENFLTIELQQLRSQLPYKMPKTHLDWATLSALIVMSTQPYKSGVDQATALHGAIWQKWVKTRSPIYCLSTELLRQFQLTDAIDLPGLIPPDWLPPLSVFCLALPNSALMSPLGHECPYIMVALHHPELPDSIPSEHPRQISVATCDRNGTIWMSGVGFDGVGFSKSRNQLGSSPTDDSERVWLQGLVSLALQCSMALTYLPELLEGDGKTESIPRRRSKPRETITTLYPRWIGRGFKRSATQHKGGVHACPRTHLRIGHWRSQAVGPGWSQHRPIWIKPRMIN